MLTYSMFGNSEALLRCWDWQCGCSESSENAKAVPGEQWLSKTASAQSMQQRMERTRHCKDAHGQAIISRSSDLHNESLDVEGKEMRIIYSRRRRTLQFTGYDLEYLSRIRKIVASE